MSCEQIREAVSARLDGEDPGLPATTLQEHLTGCGACRAWADAAAGLNRKARVVPADVLADRTAEILAAATDRGLVGADANRERDRWRWLLAGLAAVQLAAAMPGLLLGEDAGASVHVAHELGSWDVALAVGFLFAAWRPARAWGMLPLVAALVGCLVLTTGLDVADGHARLAHEAAHILEVAGLAVLWVLARPSRPPRAPRLRTA